MSDSISREQATLAIARVPTETSRDIGLINDCLNIINDLPSAERKGEWIYKDLDNFRKYEDECSECGTKYIGNYDAYDEPEEFNYCPNCGSHNPTIRRMEGEEE